MNAWTISGNVGSIGEERQAGSTTASDFTLAWNNPREKDKKEPMWVKIKLFGNQSKLVQYLHKGARVVVSGRCEYETWKDKNGGERFQIVCVANEIDLPPKSENSATNEPRQIPEEPIAPPAPRQSTPQRQAATAKAQPAPLKDYGLENDETPF